MVGIIGIPRGQTAQTDRSDVHSLIDSLGKAKHDCSSRAGKHGPTQTARGKHTFRKAIVNNKDVNRRDFVSTNLEENAAS
ncbi:MAG: hypothetical protein ACYTGP_10175 [Planctomycetota bacterium]|jgi:hypothetical protein